MHVGKITFFRIRSMSPDGPTAPDKINAETKPFHIAGIAEKYEKSVQSFYCEVFKCLASWVTCIKVRMESLLISRRNTIEINTAIILRFFFILWLNVHCINKNVPVNEYQRGVVIGSKCELFSLQLMYTSIHIFNACIFHKMIIQSSWNSIISQ